MNRTETQHWMNRIPPCPTVLHGRDIVVLGHQRWDAHFTILHGTTLRLAQYNRVLYMEPPDSAASVLHQRGARAALQRPFNRLERFGSSLGIYHVPPLFLPFQPYSRTILRSIEWTYLRMVRDGIRQMGLRNPLVWVYQFNTAAIVDALNPPLTIYECLEEASGFTENPRKRQYVREMDARLCRRADIVFVPNTQMHATRQPLNPCIDILPWPVDFEHYSQAMNPAVEVPADLRCLKPPIIGFYGNIDACRFDVPLIQGLARHRPDWSIVLIGALWPGFDPAPLREVPNIHLLGEKRLADLPAYLKGFDVGLIPYALNEFTRSITPLKLMEYLATGKPVVSSPLPAALSFANVLGIAGNVDEFESRIAAALADPLGNRDTRLDVARRHDWNHCMQRKADLIVRLLHERRRAPAELAAVAQE